MCTAEEGRLVDCVYDRDTSNCDHTNDAGATCSVICKDSPLISALDLTTNVDLLYSTL